MKMDEYEMHREKVPSMWLTVIMLIMSVTLPAIPVIIYFSGETQDVPVLAAVYVPMGVMCLFLAYNFSSIDIVVTNKNLKVGYGVFKKVYPWSSVLSVKKDENKAMRYGGFGIRMAKVDNKKWLVYNVIGGERVVVALVKGFHKEFFFFEYEMFCFSVKNAEDTIMAIERALAQK